jgi:hypothetical protein
LYCYILIATRFSDVLPGVPSYRMQCVFQDPDAPAECTCPGVFFLLICGVK